MMITTSNMPVIKFYSILKKGDILYKFPFDVSIDPGTTPDVPGFTHAHTGVPAREMITHFFRCNARISGYDVGVETVVARTRIK